MQSIPLVELNAYEPLIPVQVGLYSRTRDFSCLASQQILAAIKHAANEKTELNIAI